MKHMKIHEGHELGAPPLAAGAQRSWAPNSWLLSSFMEPHVFMVESF